MHELDIAAANPCPFCNHMFDCPRALQPRKACLELWPLGQPERRKLSDTDPRQKQWQRMALRRPEVHSIVDHWQRGRQVSDEQYLTLRELINRAETDQAAEAYWYIMAEIITPLTGRVLHDGARYYGLRGISRDLLAAHSRAVEGAVIVANRQMVETDTSVRVPSHFERIVLECIKYFLFGLTGQQLATLPRDAREFKSAVEQQWREVLGYGNGFYGFTVIPRVSILDLVRYQQLGGGDDLVSWSIGNWVLWTMTAFPVPVQIVVPEFREKALKDRLKAMYEPLVHSFPWRLRKRARVALRSSRDVAKHEHVVGELRALLDRLIDEYDFMHRKPAAQLSSVGAIGRASSPELRERLDGQLKEASLPISSRDLVHVGFARYVAGKFEEHLRQYYPIYEPEFGDAEKAAGTLGEADSEEGEAFLADSARTEETGDAGEGVQAALERKGIKYLYRRQMAFACGVDQEQLRNWDRRGELPALRVRDVDPGAARGILDRRIYPCTNEMIEKIKRLDRREGPRQGTSAERAYSRQEAAAALGIHPRTLHNWCRQGRVKTIQRGRRVFVPRDEVERLHRERRDKAR